MTTIPEIDQVITTVAPVLHRDSIDPTLPSTQDAFVQSVEAFFDKISDTTVDEINQVTTKIDTTVAAINITAQEISEVATIAIASGKYKGDWVAGFETTGYSLGDGVTFTDGYNYVSKINNNLTTPITLTNTDQWNFIEAVNPNNYYLKTETYTKTEVDTLHEINNKTDKITPIDTDNFLMEEIGGLFKKLNWANLKTNLKTTLKTYFDTLYLALTGDQIVGGVKTFTSSPIVPAPTTAFQVSTKGYVDSIISNIQALPIGAILNGYTIFDNCVVAFGGEFNRADYPKLWAYLQANPTLVKTQAQWTTESTTNGGICGFFSDGNGTTTFRVPNLDKAFLRPDSRGVAGYQGDAIRNITGRANSDMTRFEIGPTDGAFRAETDVNRIRATSGANAFTNGFNFDASRVVPTANENRPKNIAVLPLIVAK